MLEVIPAGTLHTAVYVEFTASLPMEDVQLWSAAIEAWEQDPSNAVNPFEMTVARTYYLGCLFWMEGSYYMLRADNVQSPSHPRSRRSCGDSEDHST